jgi:Tfp pilus assembly protein PilF
MKTGGFLRWRRAASHFVWIALALSGCGRSSQAERARFFTAGKQALEKQEYARAILEFKNAAKAAPQDAEVYYQLGMAYAGAGDFTSSIASFRRALALNPRHTQAQLRIAQAKASTANPALLKDAESELKGLAENASPTAEVLDTLALTQLKLGDAQDAIQNFEQVLTQSPGELKASALLAIARLSQKDVKGAEEILKKARSDAPQSSEAARLLGRFYIYENRQAEGEGQLRRAMELDPKNAAALMDLASLENRLGRKQEAEQNYKRLAALGVKNYEPVYGLFLYQDGRRDEAIREFERLAKADPDDRASRTRLIAIYRLAGRLQDARNILNQALKTNPKDLDALLQRAEFSIGEANYSEAQADLNQVLRMKPNAPEVHYFLAKLKQARGEALGYREELAATLKLNPYLLSVRIEAARDLLKDNPQGAFDLLNEAPGSQKPSLDILIQRNWALWGLGNLAEMRKGIDEGLAKTRAPELLIQDGLWKLRAGEAARARVSLEEALKSGGADVRALEALNATYVAQKQPALGLQKVREYAARETRSAPVQHLLGLLLLNQGDRAGARAAFSAAKAADPRFLDADLSLAQVDVLEKKWDDARNRLEALSSSSITAREWLGVIALAQGDYARATALFRKVIESEPDNAKALNNLAYLLAEHGKRPDEALKYAQRAVELNPDRPDYSDTLGWILYEKGLYPEAIQYLERAASSRDNAVWKYHLAMAYAKAGNAARSRSALEAALKMDPNPPEAKLAQQVVADLSH